MGAVADPVQYRKQLRYHFQQVLHLIQYISICNGIVSTKIYDKQDGFDFDKDDFSLFLNGKIPQRPSFKYFATECMHCFNPIMVDSYSELGGVGFRIKNRFNIKL